MLEELNVSRTREHVPDPDLAVLGGREQEGVRPGDVFPTESGTVAAGREQVQ
jgi:hypothetical protein